MSDRPVKGTKRLTTANTPTNAISFLVEQAIRDTVNTAELVVVKAVEAGGPEAMTGYVDVMPLVCQTDAYNNTLPPATISRLPYARMQGGIAALVLDPVPGDIGIALFAKRDSSGVKQGMPIPVQPASFRLFDQADGFYIGGVLNRQPEAWLFIDATSGEIELRSTKADVNVISDTGDITATATAGNVAVNAPTGVVTVTAAAATVDAPLTTFSGAVVIAGGLSVGGVAAGVGGSPLKTQGGMENTGGVIKSNNVTLDNHVHGGVSTGPYNTGGPAG